MANNVVEVIEMRKLFLTLLIGFLLLPNMVYAKTYYSEYGPWIETNEKVDDSELQIGKTEWKYKFYQENKKYTDDYYLIGENPNEYPYKSNNSIKTGYSSWSTEEPDKKDERQIETKEIYPYQNLKKISSLTLYDVDGSGDKLNLTEIEVIYKNEKIPITIDCSVCDNNFTKNITNEIYGERPSYLEKNKSLNILFNQEYSPKDLIVNIYISDLEGTKPTMFKIKSGNNNQDEYLNVERAYWSYSSLAGFYKDEIKLQDYIKKPFWDEQINISETKLEDEFINNLDSINYYRYQDTKYLYYKIVFDYLDGYHLKMPNYLMDENQSLPIYYKKNRNKIVLKDDIIINKNYLDIDDIILYSTVPISKLTIKNNIDFNTNGIYEINILYQDLEITTPIKLMLKNSEEQTEQVEIINNEEQKSELKKETNEQSKIITRTTSHVSKEERLNTKCNILNYFTMRNILLFILFITGLLLVVYSLDKIVERKK